MDTLGILGDRATSRTAVVAAWRDGVALEHDASHAAKRENLPWRGRPARHIAGERAFLTLAAAYLAALERPVDDDEEESYPREHRGAVVLLQGGGLFVAEGGVVGYLDPSGTLCYRAAMPAMLAVTDSLRRYAGALAGAGGVAAKPQSWRDFMLGLHAALIALGVTDLDLWPARLQLALGEAA